MENLLPEEIKLDIFSRLPAESVLECKRVCKSWRNLIHCPYFADMHLRFQLLLHQQLDPDDQNYNHNYDCSRNGAATKVGLLLPMLKGEIGYQLYYLGYDENDNDQYSYIKTIKKINHPPVYNAFHMVGSCNGLICLPVTHTHAIFDPVYICNPITREYINLPRFSNNDQGKKFRVKIVSGFGYYPSTNEYKVVRIYYTPYEGQPPFGCVQVYTLGSGTGWRNKSKIMHSLRESVGVLANGALHWMDKEGTIVAFDLADEEFHLLPSLPCFRPVRSDNYELLVLGGWLCVIHQGSFPSTNLWSLKKIKGSSCAVKEQEYQSWSWNREFSVAVKGSLYQPFAFTKRGEVLFWKNHKILCRYDPKTATSEELGNLGMHLSFNKTVTHVNSFVSLKALGEKDVMIIGSA